ncbi:hypothetical protein DID99_12645 [Burkholderia sp. Bp8986]|nr:hypothetical protein DID99_12645 [Burkholderia sp. Bp8986]RQZ47337.1 hypothetical protein DIE17_14050 [Burkholderia sp. Bp9099]
MLSERLQVPVECLQDARLEGFRRLPSKRKQLEAGTQRARAARLLQVKARQDAHAWLRGRIVEVAQALERHGVAAEA